MARDLRLHVNVDHVATVRQARRAAVPSPTEFALLCEEAGAHGITVHLRKDRRHVQDQDVVELRARVTTFLNLECSLDEEMLGLAADSGADAFCVVPENRQEVTTEGGLDVVAERERLAKAVPRLTKAGGIVSLFVDPDEAQLRAALDLGAPFVELHTGSYANAKGDAKAAELQRLVDAAALGRKIGLRVNAGHGLDLANVGAVAAIEGLEELNIGHSLVGRALMVGAREAVREMLVSMGAVEA
ncbi:MAG: pyridoxine 5'-phosphate synthase [Planctomycetota bacterium]